MFEFRRLAAIDDLFDDLRSQEGETFSNLEGHPAPPMSGRLSGQTPTGKIRVLVFCFLYLSRFHAQQVGKLRVSLVPTSSHLQQPRCLCKLRFPPSVFEAHPHLLLHS
jgi:hypothetical protein